MRLQTQLGFLYNFKGDIGRVVGNKSTVALVQGSKTPSVTITCWDTINEYFGLFNVGPCLKDCIVVSKELEIYFLIKDIMVEVVSVS